MRCKERHICPVNCICYSKDTVPTFLAEDGAGSGWPASSGWWGRHRLHSTPDHPCTPSAALPWQPLVWHLGSHMGKHRKESNNRFSFEGSDAVAYCIRTIREKNSQTNKILTSSISSAGWRKQRSHCYLRGPVLRWRPSWLSSRFHSEQPAQIYEHWASALQSSPSDH